MRWPAAFLLAVALLTAAGLTADILSLGSGDGSEELVEVFSVLSVSTVGTGESCQAAVVADIAPGWHINSAFPHQDYLIAAEVGLDTVDGLRPSDLEYPPGSDEALAGELMSVYTDRIVIPFRITTADRLADGEYTLPVSLTYQLCNNRECRAPETIDVPLKVAVGPGGQVANVAIFAVEQSSTVRDAAVSEELQEESDLVRVIADHGVWGYFVALGIAFLTGLLLSFSPCTYPMIPITVSIFAGQERTMARGFFLSLVYVGTMAVVYGIMGLIVSLVGGVFGAWLASPPVVIGMVVVFVLFALSMFGLFELNVPSAVRQKLGRTAGGGGVVGSIVLGVVAALVVSPCVGPFVAATLLYIATHGPPVIGFLTLFVFALGLGTLFIVIGTFSSAVSRLPRSGEWMESVKKFFGFVLLLMAVYFLRTLVSPVVTATITALLLIGFGVFGGGLDQLTSGAGFFPRLKKYFGLLALLLGGYLLLAALLAQGFILPAASHWLPLAGVSSPVSETGITDWETDLQRGLARAGIEGKPVIIDAWATWCAYCKVLEKRTFSDPAVGAEAERFVAIKVQLEKAGSPETLAFKARFSLKTYSLPTTLLLDSRGQLREIMIGLIEPEELISKMKTVS